MALAAVGLLAGCGTGTSAWYAATSAPAPSSSAPSSSAPSSAAAAAATTSAPASSFTLVATGDVLLNQGHDLPRQALQPDGSYDFSGVMAAVAPIIRSADVAVCHLETPLAPKGGPYQGYPRFSVQPEIATALAGAGFDQCDTASNHSMDAGVAGIARTLDTLDAAGIAHTGSYRSQADSRRPDIVDVHGIRVGFVAATWSLNGLPLPPGEPWAVDVDDVPDVDGMLAAAARARAAGAQVVVAALHCCVEYEVQPTSAQVEAGRRLLASPDVDLVLGAHAHVVQPFERIGGKWVAYGLGNFVAQLARQGPTYDSVVARFTFTRGADGRFAVTTAEAVPLSIRVDPGAVHVVPADPAAFARVAAVVGSRGALTAGLQVVHG